MRGRTKAWFLIRKEAGQIIGLEWRVLNIGLHFFLKRTVPCQATVVIWWLFKNQRAKEAAIKLEGMGLTQISGTSEQKRT